MCLGWLFIFDFWFFFLWIKVYWFIYLIIYYIISYFMNWLNVLKNNEFYLCIFLKNFVCKFKKKVVELNVIFNYFDKEIYEWLCIFKWCFYF